MAMQNFKCGALEVAHVDSTDASPVMQVPPMLPRSLSLSCCVCNLHCVPVLREPSDNVGSSRHPAGEAFFN